MTPVVSATLLLMASNVFMTFAWYAHLKNLADRPWYVAAIASWGIAGKPLKLDYVWAALCILGAVYFVFRAPGTS
jgi:uncharacterized protein (DUF486 family)